VNQDDLKLNGTHQLLFYANNFTVRGRSVYTIKENTETLVAASKEFGRETKMLINLSKYSCLEIPMQEEAKI